MFDIATLTLLVIGLALVFITMAISSLNQSISHLMRVIDAQDQRIQVLEQKASNVCGRKVLPD